MPIPSGTMALRRAMSFSEFFIPEITALAKKEKAAHEQLFQPYKPKTKLA